MYTENIYIFIYCTIYTYINYACASSAQTFCQQAFAQPRKQDGKDIPFILYARQKQKQIPTTENSSKNKQKINVTKQFTFFLSFLLQILFINRCVRHKSESCHSRDMVEEPLLFFFSSLLAVVVVVRLLVTIAAHCRERLRHTHTNTYLDVNMDHDQDGSESERGRWRRLSVAFSLLLMLSTPRAPLPIFFFALLTSFRQRN